MSTLKCLKFQILTHTSKICYFYICRSFRLANKRRFGELLLRGRGGCTEHNPGIGDIEFVKDLQSGKIVNDNFRCSLFGGHVSPLIGWVGLMHFVICNWTYFNHVPIHLIIWKNSLWFSTGYDEQVSYESMFWICLFAGNKRREIWRLWFV